CYQVIAVSLYENGKNQDFVATTTTSPFCVEFSAHNIPVLSIADASALNAIHIYPNPVRDNNLKIENIDEATDVHIYSMTGQLVQKAPAVMGNVNMDVSNLSNGVYILKMQSGKNIRTEQVHIII
ncbi:MAG: T9SS type A sorting domain-containing protein, partial [Bacteroidales bacterium]|nr:T9SS type A sorting domain-containing protein [Bacteroidales bacterium]